MSADCGHHNHKNKHKKLLVRLFATFVIIIVIVLLVFLITWAIIHPKKPKFVLQDATIYNFNITAPILLSSNFQVTVASHNPNNRVGIYYDKLDIFATYHDQQITYYTELPPGFQDNKDNTVYSPFVFGTNVPVAPYNGVTLTQDQANGAINLLFKINGRVRFKVGSYTSGRYHLRVTCAASIPFGNGNTGIVIGSGVKYQLYQSCSVNV